MSLLSLLLSGRLIFEAVISQSSASTEILYGLTQSLMPNTLAWTTPFVIMGLKYRLSCTLAILTWLKLDEYKRYKQLGVKTDSWRPPAASKLTTIPSHFEVKATKQEPGSSPACVWRFLLTVWKYSALFITYFLHIV